MGRSEGATSREESLARIKRGAVAWGAVEPAWTEESGWGADAV